MSKNKEIAVIIADVTIKSNNNRAGKSLYVKAFRHYLLKNFISNHLN